MPFPTFSRISMDFDAGFPDPQRIEDSKIPREILIFHVVVRRAEATIRRYHCVHAIVGRRYDRRNSRP